jgi:hypothetical protein
MTQGAQRRLRGGKKPSFLGRAKSSLKALELGIFLPHLVLSPDRQSEQGVSALLRTPMDRALSTISQVHSFQDYLLSPGAPCSTLISP